MRRLSRGSGLSRFVFLAAAAFIASQAIGGQLASGQTVQLIRKFEPGTKRTSLTESAVEQTLSLAGVNVDTKSTQKVTTTSSVLKRNGDGSFEVKHVIDGMQAKMNLPGGIELDIDSTNPDAAKKGTQFDFLTDVFKAMHGTAWTTFHGKDQRVLRVDGSQKTLDSIDQNLQPMFKDQLSPDSIQDAFNQDLATLPSKPVAKGDKWQRSEIQKFGSGQKMTFDTEYEYAGEVSQDGRTLDRIAFKHRDVKYSLDPNGGLPFTLSKSDLKIAESSGELLFDRKEGEVVRSTERLRVQGDLTFQAGERELPGKLDLLITKRVSTK